MPSVDASVTEPAVWSITLDRPQVRQGDEFVARIRVEIAKGFRLYSVTQPAGGPLSTRISAASGLSMNWVWPWPEPTQRFDPKFGMETECHTGSVLFDVRVRAEATLPSGNCEVVFTVEYQLCDGYTCLRPETKELRAPLVVEAAKQIATGAAGGAASASGQAADAPQTSKERLQQLHAAGKTGEKLAAGVRQILRDDPAFVLGYFVLAQRFAARGDLRRQTALLREGLAANPGSDLLHYLLADCPSAAKRRRLLNFVRRFTKSTYAAAALLGLAKLSTRHGETRKFLERAQKLTARRADAIYTERQLYPLLAESDPGRVVQLLKSGLRRVTSADGFFIQGMTSGLMKFYTSLWEIHRLLKKGKSEKAASAAQLLQEPDIPHSEANAAEKALVALFKAKALAANGQVEQAYELLIHHPLVLEQEELLDAAAIVGAQLHKSRKRMEDEAWEKMLERTYLIAEFEVPAKRGRSTRARDYRGRVLLVNVWNPG